MQLNIMLFRLKNLFYLFLLVASLIGCKKEQGLITFDQVTSVDFTYPASTLLDLPQLITPGISTNWQTNFTSHNTDKDHLREMKLRSLIMKITNPPGKTFNFLQSV